MIRLTPLHETASFQELLKEERVTLLLLLIESKFTLSDAARKWLRTDLANLSMDTLQILFPQILHIDSLEQLVQCYASFDSLETLIGDCQIPDFGQGFDNPWRAF